MPFAPFPPAPPRAPVPVYELRRKRPRPSPPPPSGLAREQIQLAPAPDLDATRAWAGHVAAGRIGASCPAPDPAAGDHRLAGLARILGRRA